MDGARWETLWAIFHAAAEAPTAQRAAILDSRCGDDAALRNEIEELLGGLENAGDFLSAAATVPGDLIDDATSPDALIGEDIDVYRLRAVIGEGGMGIVYDAEQREPVRRRVALKLIKLGMDTREVIARFEAERQALALMSHPGIANVLDAGATADGRPYFVMEYVAGMRITQYCDKHRLPIGERLALFVELCLAIEHAHQKGIIHRDIKPSNVLIAMQDGQPVVKVIDFGVAKALNQRLTQRTLFTALGRFIGTPEYMSPEQAESSGLDVDTRSDIYSLGVLLYELLCGSLPHDSKAMTSGGYATVQKTLRSVEPRRPSDKLSDDIDTSSRRQSDARSLRKQLRGDLDWVVMRALDKDRTRRYPTASEFAADVGRFLRNEPVVAGPPSTRYRLRKFVQRHTLAVTSGALFALVIGVLAAAMTVQSLRLSKALASADSEGRRAREVSAFLIDLFKQSDPTNVRGPDITVREVFNLGATRLDSDLHEQPLLKASLRETIGDVYTALGAYEDALNNLRDAEVLRRDELGADHPDVARIQARMAAVWAVKGDYGRAAELFEQALATQRAAFPAGDAELAKTLNEFGFLQMLQGRYAEAEAMQLDGLAMREALLGLKHEDVGLSYNDLAITYRRMTQFDKAERYYRRSLDIWRTLYGDSHVQVATVLNNLGVLLHIRGRFDEAAGVFEESLAIRRRELGETHSFTGLTINNLAGVFIEKGEFVRAESLYRDALNIQTQALGEDAPETISNRANVARALYEQQRYAEAIEMLTNVLADRRRLLDADNPQIATAQTWLARALIEVDRTAEAETLARDALASFTQNLPAGHWRIALAQGSLGAVLSRQGQYDEAEALLRASIDGLTEQRGAHAQLTLRTVAYLAELHDHTGP